MSLSKLIKSFIIRCCETVLHKTPKVTNGIIHQLFLEVRFPFLIWQFKDIQAGFLFTDWSIVLTWIIIIFKKDAATEKTIP